jgi:uncharacterized protein (DUF3820 family)
MIFPFGKYKGRAVSDIPLSYLHWCWHNTDFQGDAFLKHKVGVILGKIVEPKEEENWFKPKPPPSKDPLIERLLDEIQDLKDQVEDLEMRKKNNFDKEYFDKWYSEIMRIAHPDRGGDTRVTQLINELREKLFP